MEILIIGSGPCGVSAALYATRAGHKVTIVAKDIGALGKTDEIENYYGFSKAISAKELHDNALAGAVALGAVHVADEILNIEYDGSFKAHGKQGTYAGERLLLATGANRAAPRIKGLSEREGAGVSYCAICDAFFFRGKDVCVLGAGDFAVHEAEVLANVANSVTILTNGEEFDKDVPFAVKKEKIAEIVGDGKVEEIVFASGDKILASAVFIALGVAGSTAFAASLGALTDGVKIVVDDKMKTTISNLFAGGDCVGGMYQIAKAVHDGMVAGIEMSKQ